jgi:hypothetical protein
MVGLFNVVNVTRIVVCDFFRAATGKRAAPAGFGPLRTGIPSIVELAAVFLK